MGRMSRTKGQAGEREVTDLLKAHGWKHAHRNHQSGGQGGGDIARGPQGVHLEVKRTERVLIREWWQQASSEALPGESPVVLFRWSRGPWLCVMEADEALSLVALGDRGTASIYFPMGDRVRMRQWWAEGEAEAKALPFACFTAVSFRWKGGPELWAWEADEALGLLALRERG